MLAEGANRSAGSAPREQDGTRGRAACLGEDVLVSGQASHRALEWLCIPGVVVWRRAMGPRWDRDPTCEAVRVCQASPPRNVKIPAVAGTFTDLQAVAQSGERGSNP
jgi:hypothetical protein